jgi:hypothetical protein
MGALTQDFRRRFLSFPEDTDTQYNRTQEGIFMKTVKQLQCKPDYRILAGTQRSPPQGAW